MAELIFMTMTSSNVSRMADSLKTRYISAPISFPGKLISRLGYY